MSEGFSRRRFLGGLGTAAGASALALGVPEAQVDWVGTSTGRAAETAFADSNRTF